MFSTFLIAAALKVLLLALPVAVGLLALRRTIQSQSANAWLYGATLLYACVTTFGLLPWAVGLGAPPALFLSFSALSPLVWMMVVMLCDRDRVNRYDNNGLPDHVAPPLLLVNPTLPPVPVFRHQSPEDDAPAPQAVARPALTAARKVAQPDPGAEVTRNVLAVARAMRGRLSEEEYGTPKGRKAANAPDPDHLPFLTRAPG